MKSMVMLMVAAVIVGGALCVPAGAQSQIPTRTVNPGYPSNFDPRFGSISSRPTFELPERVNPAFRAQPIIIAPGAQTPVTAPPDAQFVCVPGQWFWSGMQWVWYPGYCTR